MGKHYWGAFINSDLGPAFYKKKVYMVGKHIVKGKS